MTPASAVYRLRLPLNHQTVFPTLRALNVPYTAAKAPSVFARPLQHRSEIDRTLEVLPGIISKLVEMSPYEKNSKRFNSRRDSRSTNAKQAGQAHPPNLETTDCPLIPKLESLSIGNHHSTLISSWSGRCACPAFG